MKKNLRVKKDRAESGVRKGKAGRMKKESVGKEREGRKAGVKSKEKKKLEDEVVGAEGKVCCVGLKASAARRVMAVVKGKERMQGPSMGLADSGSAVDLIECRDLDAWKCLPQWDLWWGQRRECRVKVDVGGSPRESRWLVALPKQAAGSWAMAETHVLEPSSASGATTPRGKGDLFGVARVLGLSWPIHASAGNWSHPTTA